MLSAAERIKDRQTGGRTMEEIQAQQNTDMMFWVMTLLASTLFLAVAVWKYFFYQSQISVSHHGWEIFLEVMSAGASEFFRSLSLIMAFYEAKKGRTVTVWFGIILSILIMFYDIHLGRLVATASTVETYLFLCVVSEIIGIRAVFGYAFEDAFVKLWRRSPEIKDPAPEISEDPHLDHLMIKDLIPQDIREMSDMEGLSGPAPEISEDPIQVSGDQTIRVHGFSKPFTAPQVRTKFQEYVWKLENGQGKKETNEDRLEKFSIAYKKLTGETLLYPA